jgi:hypothetical protein
MCENSSIVWSFRYLSRYPYPEGVLKTSSILHLNGCAPTSWKKPTRDARCAIRGDTFAHPLIGQLLLGQEYAPLLDCPALVSLKQHCQKESGTGIVKTHNPLRNANWDQNIMIDVPTTMNLFASNSQRIQLSSLDVAQ